MRIDHLELINFKKYIHLHADFGAGVNLLVGANGSGKTSLLEGVNVAAGVFFYKWSQKMQRYIDVSEVRIESRERVPEVRVVASSDLIPGGAWERRFNTNSNTNTTRNDQEVRLYGQSRNLAFDMPEVDLTAPLIAYYSTSRLFADARLTKHQKYDVANGRRNGYLEALSGKSIKLTISDWWAKAVTSRANKSIVGVDDFDRILDNVERGLKTALVRLGFTERDFLAYSEPLWNNELFIQVEKEKPLPLSYYSDGFRNLVYLVVDLLWRASHLNPDLSLEQLQDQQEGIVTIDEIDLHLHPKWQAQAIPILQILFPKVQFFITTHSPTVISNFKGGQLYTLFRGDEIARVRLAYGKVVDEIQEDVLHGPIRSPETQQELNRLYELIRTKRPAHEYGQSLARLRKELGSENEAIQLADSMIEMNKYEEEKEGYAVREEDK